MELGVLGRSRYDATARSLRPAGASRRRRSRPRSNPGLGGAARRPAARRGRRALRRWASRLRGSDRDEYERTVEALGTLPGAPAVDEATAEGRTLPLERAVEEALALLGDLLPR